MFIRRIVLGLAAALAPFTLASADPSERSLWTLNGYGTLGAIHSSEDRADYLPSIILDEGVGRSDRWSLDFDSRAAVQLGVHPTERLSAVVQVLVEERQVDGYEPELEWAHLRYRLSDGLSIGAGRTALDTFLVSAHRKVGYALPWVRPPAELYRMVPLTNVDGVDLGYRKSFGPINWRGHVSYGENDAEATGSAVVADPLWAASSTLEWGSATFHASYLRAEARSSASDEFFVLFDAFGPEGAAVKHRYDLNGTWYYLGLGASYEPGDWFVMGEWGTGETRSLIGGAEAWYVSGGYRLGRLTPFLTWAESDRTHGLTVEGLTPSAYPLPLAAAAMSLNELLTEGRRSAAVQRTVSVGARYDLARNFAVKLQYDHVDVRDGSPGMFINPEPGFRPDGADLFSVSVDFLF